MTVYTLIDFFNVIHKYLELPQTYTKYAKVYCIARNEGAK